LANTLWLRAELTTLAKRVAGTDRPWLGRDPLHALQQLYAGREGLYESVASLIVDVDVAPPDLIALHIAEFL